MKSLTIRNIPADILDKAKAVALSEQRSLNQSILLLIKQGLDAKIAKPLLSQATTQKDTQLEIWNMISGKWQDDRTTEQLIDDIYSARTKGRNVKL